MEEKKREVGEIGGQGVRVPAGLFGPVEPLAPFEIPRGIRRGSQPRILPARRPPRGRLEPYTFDPLEQFQIPVVKQDEQPFEDLWNRFREPLPEGIRSALPRYQQTPSPSYDEMIVNDYDVLSLPCEALFKAIGVRQHSTKLGTEKFDTSQGRGRSLYFKCILFYKGDLEQTCDFTNNTQRRCNLFVQFYENASESPVHEPVGGWGRLRPIIYPNARSPAVDAVQNYEYQLEAPKESTHTEEIPRMDWQPLTLEETIRAYDPLRSANLLAQLDGATRYSLNNFHNILDRESKAIKDAKKWIYKPRPSSNLVTNTGLHYYIIAGTGGKLLSDYRHARYHPHLLPYMHDYIKELHRMSTVSIKQHTWRGLMLNMPHFPKPIRSFHLTRMNAQELNTQSFPIWQNLAAGEGLIDTDTSLDNIRQGKFSFVSQPLLPEFKRMVQMSNRENMIQSQVMDEKDYQDKPLFISQRAQARAKEASRIKNLQLDRALRSRKWDPNIRAFVNELEQETQLPLLYKGAM